MEENSETSSWSNRTNFTDEPYDQQAFDHYDHTVIFRLFIELYTFTSILCMAADVFIIYCVFKYRRLRKERCNILLLNWCVGNILFMLFSPLLFRMAHYTNLSLVSYCVLEQLELVSLLSNVLMMSLMSVYWFLKLYTTTKFEKFARHINYYVIGAYCACLFYAGVSARACYGHTVLWFLTHIVVFLICAVYFVMSLALDVAHLWKRRRLSAEERRRADAPFVLSHIYYGSFYSFFVVLMMLWLLDESNYLAFTVIYCVLILLVTMTPLYFLVALYAYDGDFNVFLRHVLSCRCRSYRGDELAGDRSVAFSNENVEERC